MNFGYLDDLIHSGQKEIALGCDIVLGDDEALYETGIDLDVDDIVVDGNNHVIDGKARAVFFNVSASNVTLKNIIFKDSFSENGAAIFVDEADVLMENIEIRNAVSKNNGAGIFNNNGKLKIGDSSFIGNCAMRGAAIYSNGGEIEISSSCFKDNVAFRNGGAVRVAHSDLKIDGCDFIANKSTSGGAVHNFFSKLEIIESKFIANLVESDGGAIYNYYDRYDVSTKIRDSLFRDNLAQNLGGAVRLNWGEISLSGCDLEENKAERGGAAYVSWGFFAIESSRLDGNYARDGGGAIFAESGLRVIDSSISHNCADSVWGSGGGAIYNGSFADISDSILSHNSVKGYGGAIYNGGYKAKLKIRDSEINENMAEDGGPIFNMLMGEVELDGCTFRDNEPENGF